MATGLFQHSRIKLVYAVEKYVNDTERLLKCIDVNIQTKTEDVYEKCCDEIKNENIFSRIKRQIRLKYIIKPTNQKYWFAGNLF
jgi:hypothetical protein